MHPDKSEHRRTVSKLQVPDPYPPGHSEGHEVIPQSALRPNIHPWASLIRNLVQKMPAWLLTSAPKGINLWTSPTHAFQDLPDRKQPTGDLPTDPSCSAP